MYNCTVQQRKLKCCFFPAACRSDRDPFLRVRNPLRHHRQPNVRDEAELHVGIELYTTCEEFYLCQPSNGTGVLQQKQRPPSELRFALIRSFAWRISGDYVESGGWQNFPDERYLKWRSFRSYSSGWKHAPLEMTIISKMLADLSCLFLKSEIVRRIFSGIPQFSGNVTRINFCWQYRLVWAWQVAT